MTIERSFGVASLYYAKHGLLLIGATKVALTIFAMVMVGIVADYARMLYKRSKMVSPPMTPEQYMLKRR